MRDSIYVLCASIYISSPPYSAGVFDRCLCAAPLESCSRAVSFPPGAGAWGWGPNAAVASGARYSGWSPALGDQQWLRSWERGDSFPKCLWLYFFTTADMDE